MAQPSARLSAETPPDVALRHIVAECHRDLRKYRDMALHSRRPEGIHQTRVALRRLRAAFGLFGGTLDGPAGRAIAAEAKWLAGECGPARDLHVFLHETVEDAPPLVMRIGRRLGEAHLNLTRSEFKLLALLMNAPGRLYSRADVMRILWHDYHIPGDRSVDNIVLRLRRKLGDYGEDVETVRGIGYRLRRAQTPTI